MDRVKLTDQQIATIQEMQSKNSDMAFALGQLELQNLNLKLVKESLEAEFKKLTEEQTEFSVTLEKEHGFGQIDFQTGEYVKYPTSEQEAPAN